VSKDKQRSTKSDMVDFVPDTSEWPRIIYQADLNKKSSKQAKVHQAELNTNYFPESLIDSVTDNEYLKQYLETRQPKYLFEAINRDANVLQDQIVIETIKSWRTVFNSSRYIINEVFGGLTVGQVDYADY
jgi:mevalonate pyrophosphate decarboxylase